MMVPISATAWAVMWTLFAWFAHGMRSAPGKFRGGVSIFLFWGLALGLWLNYVIGRITQ